MEAKRCQYHIHRYEPCGACIETAPEEYDFVFIMDIEAEWAPISSSEKPFKVQITSGEHPTFGEAEDALDKKIEETSQMVPIGYATVPYNIRETTTKFLRRKVDPSLPVPP